MLVLADMFQQIGTALIVVSALLAFACVTMHSLLARWWRTPAGRHAFSFEAVLALCLCLWASRLVVPEGDWFLLLRLAAFALVPVILAWRLVIIIQTWRRTRRNRAKGEA